jgi:hypothetical protein
MTAVGSPMGLGLTYSTPERGRRGSGSYYNVSPNLAVVLRELIHLSRLLFLTLSTYL